MVLYRARETFDGSTINALKRNATGNSEKIRKSFQFWYNMEQRTGKDKLKNVVGLIGG